MFEDNISDYATSANLIVTQTTFDKRALCTNDLCALANSLSNMHYLSIHFPVRLASLLASNGCLELVIRKARQVHLPLTLSRWLSTLTEEKAEISFSAALSCLASAAACGNSQLRCRIVQANFVIILHLFLDTVFVADTSFCLYHTGVYVRSRIGRKASHGDGSSTHFRIPRMPSFTINIK